MLKGVAIVGGYPRCCCKKLIVAVYNSNGITDDDFELKLNGNVIVASMPETDTSCSISPGLVPCRGHLVRPSGITWEPDPGTGDGCDASPPTWSTYTANDLADWSVLTSTPLFRLTSIVDNLCNNFGRFIVYCWNENTSTATEIYNSTYSMAALGYEEYSVDVCA